MLSPDQVASQGPGGFLNLNGGATDPYYALANGAGYASVADACAAVPTAARRNRTVNVLGEEYWWMESDLSDNGLVLKTAASSGGGSGGALLTYNFSFSVTTDGAQSIPLPAGTDGVLYVVVQTTYGVTRPLLPSHYRLSGSALIVDEDAGLVDGETIEGKRYTGGGSGSAGRDFNNVPQSVRDAVRAAGHTWSYGDLTAYASAALEAAALDGVQKGDYFDAFEAGSTVDAYRYCYCLQNDSSLGWTRIYKLQ
jgi:hypothetical protein